MLTQGDELVKFIEWVKEFVLEHNDNHQRKNLPFSDREFEELGYSPNFDIDEEIFLAIFFGDTAQHRAFSDCLTSVRQETFG